MQMVSPLHKMLPHIPPPGHDTAEPAAAIAGLFNIYHRLVGNGLHNRLIMHSVERRIPGCRRRPRGELLVDIRQRQWLSGLLVNELEILTRGVCRVAAWLGRTEPIVELLLQLRVDLPIERGELVPVLEEFSTPFPGFYLYYPERRQASPPLRALVDYLRQKRRGARSKRSRRGVARSRRGKPGGG